MNIHQNCWSGQTLLLPPYILTMTWSLFVPGVAADDSKPHPPDSLMHPTIVKTPNNIQRDMRTGYIKHIRCTYTQKRDQREYWTLPCICSHFVTNNLFLSYTQQHSCCIISLHKHTNGPLQSYFVINYCFYCCSLSYLAKYDDDAVYKCCYCESE